MQWFFIAIQRFSNQRPYLRHESLSGDDTPEYTQACAYVAVESGGREVRTQSRHGVCKVASLTTGRTKYYTTHSQRQHRHDQEVLPSHPFAGSSGRGLFSGTGDGGGDGIGEETWLGDRGSLVSTVGASRGDSGLCHPFIGRAILNSVLTKLQFIFIPNTQRRRVVGADMLAPLRLNDLASGASLVARSLNVWHRNATIFVLSVCGQFFSLDR